MLGNIYNNSTTSGGGDASIDDSTSSVTGTYSSAKIDSDNAAQDANQNAKYEIDANAIVSPAGITFDPSSTHNSIIMNPAAAANEYGSITMLSAVCIGRDVAKNGNAYSTVAIGHDSLKDGASSSSVHVGINSGSNCRGNNHVHVGTGTGGSDGGEGGATSSRDGDTAIGTFSGLGEGRNLNRDFTTFIGNRCNDTMKNYANSADITVSDFDVIIGASNNNIGPNNNRPLIHANGDDDGSTPHWSPGKAADLGTTVNLWQNIYLSGTINLPNSTSISSTGAIFSTSATVQVGGIKIKTDKIEIGGTDQYITEKGTTGMYDYCEIFAATDSSNYTDASSQLLSLSSTNTAPSLGHMTISNTGGYTTIQNTSGETRRWLISTNVWIYAPIGGSTLMTTQTWVMISSSRGAATSTNHYVHCYSNADGHSDAFKGVCSEVVEIAANDYVHICASGNTTDGASWKVFGNTWKAEDSSSVTITELPT